LSHLVEALEEVLDTVVLPQRVLVDREMQEAIIVLLALATVGEEAEVKEVLEEMAPRRVEGTGVQVSTLMELIMQVEVVALLGTAALARRPLHRQVQVLVVLEVAHMPVGPESLIGAVGAVEQTQEVISH
jgi:hypothetical protein